MLAVDSDFGKYDREKVVEFITQRYGETKFASIGQFGYLWDKSAIKDVGKVLDIPYAIRNKITQELGDMTIELARETGNLSNWIEQYPQLFEYAEKLAGTPKSFGIHPCGKIVSTKDIDYYTGVASNDGTIVFQGDMDDTDDLGLVKADLLGLKSLDIIYDCLEAIGEDYDYINPDKLDFTDKKVLDLFRTGQTASVFQFESVGMKETLRDVHPDGIEDLGVCNALFRPSSMKYISHYAKRKRGEEKVVYLHPDLEGILGETMGIWVFQEQMISLAKLSGMRSPDTIRKAIGKKKFELMVKAKDELFDGLRKRNWNEDQLAVLWQDMIDFSSYSFNKSHSTAYAIIAFQMAKLKVYHPIEFMKATLNVNIGDRVDVSVYVNECKRMGIEVLPPDINKSHGKFTIEGDKIRFGLIGIKGVGEPTVKIVDTLRDSFFGKFNTLEHFYQLAVEKANAGQVDMLPTDAIINFIKSGMFGANKNEVLMQYGNLIYTSLIYKERKTIPAPADFKKIGLSISDEDMKDKAKRWKIFVDYKYEQYLIKDEKRKVKHLNEFVEKYITDEDLYEFHTMACYLTVSPFDNYLSSINNFYDYEDETNKVLIVGTVLDKKVKKSSRGGQYAKLTVLTPHGVLEGKAYSAQYAEYKQYLDKNEIVVILAKRNKDEFIMSKLKTFDEWKLIIERKRRLKEKEMLKK